MPKYRKKPVVIEAVAVRTIVEAAFTGEAAAWKQLPEWVRQAWDDRSIVMTAYHGQKRQLAVDTLEGRMTAAYEDWLIQGVKGELYPCKPDIFQQTYEEVK